MKSNRPAAAAGIRYGLLALALAIIAAGVIRGEQLEVLNKAVRICLECIGIG